MAKVLVLDGRQRSTLAVVRSLGRRGIEVVVGEDRFPCLSSSSKYCRGTFQYASASAAPQDFMRDLERELQRHEYKMLLPMTDMTTYLTAANFDRLSALTMIPMANKDHYFQSIDKSEVITLAEKLGIPTPKTYFINGIEDVKKLTLIYPMVIKSRQSKYLKDGKWVEAGVDYAYNLDELIGKLGRWNSSLPLPLLQERITGPGEGAFLLFNYGEPRAIFFHRRIREKPLSGGVSVLRESIAVDPHLQDYSIRLLKALKWHGVAMVEFKHDEKDNLPKVMEINARFWGSLQLAIDAGVDFPYMLYRMVDEGDVETQFGYRTGIKTRWLLGDVDILVARLFKPESQLRLPPGYPGRLKSLWEFCKIYQPGTKYEIEKLTDPGPFFNEFKEWFWQLLGR